MHRWHATSSPTLTRLIRVPSSRLYLYAIHSLSATKPSSRSYAAARTDPSDPDITSEIHSLRKQERLALYQLRENAEDFIRHMERILAPAHAVPPPEALLTSTTSPRQYISTERYDAAVKNIEYGAAIIRHAREIQEHCKELEVEPHDERQITRRDSFTQDSSSNPPDFIALKLEEKARTKDITDRLKELSRRTGVAKQATKIAAHDGVSAAHRFLKRVEGKTLAGGGGGALSTQLSGKSVPLPKKPSLLSSGWDDLQGHMEEQLKTEGVVAQRSRR